MRGPSQGWQAHQRTNRHTRDIFVKRTHSKGEKPARASSPRCACNMDQKDVWRGNDAGHPEEALANSSSKNRCVYAIDQTHAICLECIDITLDSSRRLRCNELYTRHSVIDTQAHARQKLCVRSSLNAPPRDGATSGRCPRRGDNKRRASKSRQASAGTALTASSAREAQTLLLKSSSRSPGLRPCRLPLSARTSRWLRDPWMLVHWARRSLPQLRLPLERDPGAQR